MKSSIRFVSPTALVMLAVTILASSGCGNRSPERRFASGDAGKVEGVAHKEGSTLAYEHRVDFRVAEPEVPSRVEAVRAACDDARFGACELLSMRTTAGERAHGEIVVRTVPAAIQPLVALGGKPAEIVSHETSAEDLAQPIAETADRLQRLTSQRQQLDEILKRKDLEARDVISLTQEIANIDSEIHDRQQDAANQRRRVETNLLRLVFATAAEDADTRGRRPLWSLFVDNLKQGVEGSVEYAGYLLPLFVLFFPVALLVRILWRWATRRREPGP